MWTKNHSRSLLKQYKHYVDEDIKSDILDFHARTVLTVPGNIPTYFVDPRLQAVISEATRTEELLEPHLEDVVSLPLIAENAKARGDWRRSRSASNFSTKRHLRDSDLKKILALAYCRIKDTELHRSYPSAGGLFPISVFIYKFSQKAESFPAGAYYLLPHSRMLQPRGKRLEPKYERRLYDAFHLNRPSASIIYVLNLERAIFKYSYRGYRHGIIEVGLMAQTLDYYAECIGVKTRLFSGINDNWINQYLNISPQIYLPMLVQQIGYEQD